MGDLKAYSLPLASQGWGQCCGTKTCLPVDSVRIELKCRTPSWCYGELLGAGGETCTHSVTKSVRSEVFYVSSKGEHRKERLVVLLIHQVTQKEENDPIY